MKAGQKFYTYRSTMLAYTDFFDFLVKEKVDEQAIDVVKLLWHAYSIQNLITSEYFEFLRIGDYKYNLSVQRYCTGAYCVKLQVNNNVE